MWVLDHKEGWMPKNWCFQTVLLEKTLESPLDSKEIKPVYPKGNQPWIFIGRTYAEAEAPILSPDVKSWLVAKVPDAGKDWRQKEKGQQRLRWLDSIINLVGYEFEQTLGGSEGQGSLACCSPWGHNESDTTEWTAAAATAKWDIISSVNSSKVNFSCPYLSYLKPSFRLIN